MKVYGLSKSVYGTAQHSPQFLFQSCKTQYPDYKPEGTRKQCWSPCECTHACTTPLSPFHIVTWKHTHTHTHTHVCLHLHIHTTHTCACACTHTHTHIHTHTQNTPALAHTHTHTHTCACVCVCTHTHTQYLPFAVFISKVMLLGSSFNAATCPPPPLPKKTQQKPQTNKQTKKNKLLNHKHLGSANTVSTNILLTCYIFCTPVEIHKSNHGKCTVNGPGLEETAETCKHIQMKNK